MRIRKWAQVNICGIRRKIFNRVFAAISLILLINLLLVSPDLLPTHLLAQLSYLPLLLASIVVTSYFDVVNRSFNPRIGIISFGLLVFVGALFFKSAFLTTGLLLFLALAMVADFSVVGGPLPDPTNLPLMILLSQDCSFGRNFDFLIIQAGEIHLRCKQSKNFNCDCLTARRC